MTAGPRRFLFNAAGVLCLIVGGIGAVLPVLPTTPFLLLGGWLFARGNPELGERLLSMPIFRPYRVYLDGTKPIPARARGYTIALVWAVVGTSAWFVRSRVWIVAVLGVSAAIGTVVVLRFRRTLDYRETGSAPR
jgi:hypothetical protein